MYYITRQGFALLILSLFSLFLVACGGGGGGDGASTPVTDQSPTNVSVATASLSGNWYGTIEDPAGDLYTLAIAVDNGSLTQIVIDGVSSGLVGTLTKEAGQIFSILLSDGSDAAFITDRTGNYLTFVDEDFSFGVLQKGAIALPAYVIDDVNGAWEGVSVWTDTTTFEQYGTTADCASLTCTASASNGVSSVGDLTASFDAGFGRWIGSYSNTAGSVGNITVMLSPDRQFAAAYGCDLAGFFPEDCDFTGWERQ